MKAYNSQEIPLDTQIINQPEVELGAEISLNQIWQLVKVNAYRGMGRVSPNPLVGAVIVDAEGRFLGAGGHEKVGEAHAEINALKSIEGSGAEEKLKGATLYVSLEPCAHEGRTPSCAKTLAQIPFAKVVYGIGDPNPLVSGKGIEILNAAGIKTEIASAEVQEMCSELAEIFLCNQKQSKLFVALKAATTFDGSIARKGDKKSWITSERSRAYGHFLRGYYDAVAVGANTLALDNPKLDSRRKDLVTRDPVVVVFDPFMESFKAYKDFRNMEIFSHGPKRVIWVAAENQDASAIEKFGARVIRAPARNQWLDLKVVHDGLWELGIRSLLLEGGAGLYGSFLQSGLVDKIYLFQTDQIWTGDDRIHWLGEMPNEFRLPFRPVKASFFDKGNYLTIWR